MKGFQQVRSKLSAMPDKTLEAGKTGLRQTAKSIFDESQSQYVPVDTGALKASGKVEEKEGSNKLTITISYDTPYALPVHEIARYRHPHGAYKYLETPFNSNVPKLVPNIQSKMKGLT
jgi:hypothetical protein